MYLFEVIMLLCFGISWPISIYKSVSTHKVSGKSPLFMVIIMIGYTAGIINKYLHSNNWIIWMYLINLIMVGVDLILYYKFSPLEEKKIVTKSE